MKRVLFLHHCSGIGGALNSGLNVCKIIQSMGYSVDLLIPKITNYIEDNVEGVGIIQSEYDIQTFSYYNGSGSIIRACLQYIKQQHGRKIKEYYRNLFCKYDLILFNSMTVFPMFKYSRGLNVKKGVFIRETLKHNRITLINSWIMKRFKDLDSLAFISKYDYDQWNIDSSRKFVVYNAFTKSSSIKKDYSSNQGCFTMLYVGGMSELKGAKELLEACALLGEIDYRLIILGDLGKRRDDNIIKRIIYRRYNHYLDTVSKIMKNPLFSDRIITLGITENVMQYYKESDILIFPAKMAHQARPIFEAGAFHIPVIVPNFPNYHEFVINEFNGLTYEEGNVLSLSNVIQKCSSGEVDIEKMGENNYQLYNSRHTFEAVGEQLKKMMNFLIG